MACNESTTIHNEKLFLVADAKRQAGGYSGGMKRKLSLAIAVITHPKVLFLDGKQTKGCDDSNVILKYLSLEITTGLDPASCRQIWTFLKQYRSDNNATIVITTHRMAEADVYI
jgi:ABC-2 type transport system ATP-binding protein